MKNYTLLFAALFAMLFTSCLKEELQETTVDNNALTTPIEGLDNKVLDISPKKTITEFLQGEDDFSIFYDALVHSDLASLLFNDNITVFAPNNAAMKQLMTKGQYATIQEMQPTVLKQFMMCHISLTGEHTINADERGQEIEILHDNQTVYMKTTDGTVQYKSSKTKIYVANKQQVNGIIHQVTGVLIP